ncbi:hypothetical protein ACWD0G_24150 [Streptomyces goshikiensis]
MTDETDETNETDETDETERTTPMASHAPFDLLPRVGGGHLAGFVDAGQVRDPGGLGVRAAETGQKGGGARRVGGIGGVSGVGGMDGVGGTGGLDRGRHGVRSLGLSACGAGP